MKKQLFLLIIILGNISCQRKDASDLTSINDYLESNRKELEKLIQSKNEKYPEKFAPFYIEYTKYKNESELIKQQLSNTSEGIESINFAPYINMIQTISQVSTIRKYEGDTYNLGIEELFSNSEKSSLKAAMNKVLIIDILVANRIIRELDYTDFKFDVLKPKIHIKNDLETKGDSLEIIISPNPFKFYDFADLVVLGELDSEGELIEPLDTIILDKEKFTYKVSRELFEQTKMEGIYIHNHEFGSWTTPLKTEK